VIITAEISIAQIFTSAKGHKVPLDVGQIYWRYKTCKLWYVSL